MRRRRVLIADSVSIFRSGVRRLLGSDFDIVEAADLQAVLEVVLDDAPDVALVELELPGGGLEAVTRLAQSDCRVIAWSYEPSGDAILDAIRAGGSGYLDRTVSRLGLLRALRSLERGEAPLSRHFATLLVDALHGRERRQDTLQRAAVLSAREREVLDLVSRGARNRQIADALLISEFTVKRHVQNILKKLGLPSRQAAATFYAAASASGFDRLRTPLGGAA